MILSAFERKDSPWVWIQYRLHPADKKQYTKTKVRKDAPDKKKRLQLAMSQLETHLLTTESQGGEGEGGHGGWGWVVGYLKARYGRKESAGTLRVYLGQWKALAPFLAAHHIRSPGELTRQHCMSEYVAWRTAQTKQKSRRHPLLNTAIGELKLLGLLMEEAIERKLADDNPARRLKLQREEVGLKPEISDAEAALIYRELASRPAWMRHAFHLALQTGLRFAETQIDLARVDWASGAIFIATPKGGSKRAFSIQLYPAIEGALREVVAAGEQFTWSLPPKERQLVGLAWNKFFREIGLPHLCFHCTRVSFISRGARAGIPESAMMKMVNHGAKDIHRIYQRLRPSDALHYRSLIQMPQPPESPPPAGAMRKSPRRTASRRPAASPVA